MLPDSDSDCCYAGLTTMPVHWCIRHYSHRHTLTRREDDNITTDAKMSPMEKTRTLVGQTRPAVTKLLLSLLSHIGKVACHP